MWTRRKRKNSFFLFARDPRPLSREGALPRKKERFLTFCDHPKARQSLQARDGRHLFPLLRSSPPTLRANPSPIGVILTGSFARPPSAPSTCPRSQAFRVRSAIFSSRQRYAGACFLLTRQKSYAAVPGTLHEHSKLLRWPSYTHERFFENEFRGPTSDCSQPRYDLCPPLHFPLILLSRC